MKQRFIGLVHGIERWSGFLGVLIGVIALIAGVALGVWSVRKSEEIAQRSGGFDKPEVRLFLGNWPLTQDYMHAVFLGAAFEPKSVTLIPLPLRVANVSQNRTAEDITVVITFPKLIREGILEFATRNVKRTDPGLTFIEEHNEIGHFEIQSYNFPRLNPGTGIGLEEPVGFSKATALTVPVPEASMSLDVTYGYTIDIRIDQKNAASQSYRLFVSAMKAASPEALHREVETQIAKQRNQARRHASFREYAAMLIAQRNEHALVGFAQPAKATTVADGKLVQAESLMGRVERVDYPQATWNRLFQ